MNVNRNEFDLLTPRQKAEKLDGEPQFMIHCQIRDWLDEVTASIQEVRKP